VAAMRKPLLWSKILNGRDYLEDLRGRWENNIVDIFKKYDRGGLIYGI
jgi:hypothetical protein